MFGTAAFAQLPYASAPGAEIAASVAETVQAVEALAAATTFITSFSDTAVSVDAIGAAFAVFANTAEAVVASAGTPTTSFSINADLSEMAGIQDAVSAAATFPCALSDTAAAVESLIGLPTYAAQIAETAATADDTAAIYVAAAQVVETATALDAAVCIFVFPAEVDERANASETAAAATTYPSALAEYATVFDAGSAAATFPVQVSAQVQAVLNSVVATSAFLASVTENVQAADVLIGAFLWNDIDDAQVPGWTDILRPTTITDYAVFGDANFGVTSFAGQTVTRYDPASTNWSSVDDTQNPEWTVIDAV